MAFVQQFLFSAGNGRLQSGRTTRTAHASGVILALILRRGTAVVVDAMRRLGRLKRMRLVIPWCHEIQGRGSIHHSRLWRDSDGLHVAAGIVASQDGNIGSKGHKKAKIVDICTRNEFRKA